MFTDVDMDYKDLYWALEGAIDDAIFYLSQTLSECQLLLEDCGKRKEAMTESRFDAVIRTILQGGLEDDRPDYKKMYHLLFHTVTMVIHHLDNQDYDQAKLLLTLAKQRTEELYHAACKE